MAWFGTQQAQSHSVEQSFPSARETGTILDKLLTFESRRIFSGIYDQLFTLVGPEPCRIVLVCSANSGEGTTSVAAGLAIAAAAKCPGPVLLIDGNVHDPTVCKIFGLTEQAGLGNFLTDNTASLALVQQTAIVNLSVMDVGVLPNDYIPALESRNFRSLLEHWSLTYRFIVLDGPAINVHPEPLLYAPQVDRVLLVVRAGKTRAPVVAKALAKLAEAGCDKIEIILNRRTFVIPQAIYEKL